MLRKDWIRKDIVMLSEEWFAGRLARLTASEWYHCMGEKFETIGCINYIYRKVGEELSGLPCRDEINTQGTEHGHRYEADNLRQLMKIKDIPFLITQQLISAPDSRFGATPDALIFHSESSDGLHHNVSTVEAKCPSSFDGYIKLALCQTPQDVKKAFPSYYHQVLFQMSLCDALYGYLVAFQPFFKVGNTRIIEFRKINLISDFKLMEERKIMAENKFIEVREKLMNIKN